MPTNLLLLPLLAGYFLLHQFNYTRFRAQRLDGYRLLLESAFVGLVLAGAVRILVSLAVRWSPPNGYLFWVAGVVGSAFPGEHFVTTAVVSLFLGLTLPLLANLKCDVEKAQRWAINRYGNQILRLVHQAAQEERLVSVTLDNRKVYIGVVKDAPNLESHDSFLSVVPFFSGSRETGDLHLNLTVDYLKFYEANPDLDKNTFRVVVPIANVRMISFFDQAVYPKIVMSPPNLTSQNPDGLIAEKPL